MSRYKVLPVPSFFRTMYYFHDETENIFDVIKYELGNRCQFLVPVFNRDGWYYDRIRNFSWYEYANIACTKEGEEKQFLYELEQLNTKVLEPAEIKAINTLRVYGSCPKELVELLYKDEQNRHLREIYKTRFEVKKRFRRFKQEIGNKNENVRTN